MFYEGVLLMELVQDVDGRPAPRLIDVAIEPAAAVGVYADLVAQIIAMLCCDLIHGDLSPYNILAAADGPTIIDFPQVVSAVHSSRAEFFFLRDFDNVVRFVSGFDPALAIHRHDGRAIWRAYVSRELTRDFVPPPPPPPQARGGRPDRGRDQRFDARGDQRHGDDRNTRGQDRRSAGGPQRSSSPPQRSSSPPQRSSSPPQRSSSPPQREPQRSNGPPRHTGPVDPDPRQRTGSDPRTRPAPRGSNTAPQGTPRPQHTQTQGRSPERPLNDRAPAPQRQRPPSREWSNQPASPASPARGRRRRPKRHW